MVMSAWGLLGTLLVCACFLAGGVIALIWPKRIQTWALAYFNEGPGRAQWNPLRDWMRTSSYVVSLRIVGVLSIAAGCLVLLAAVRGGA